ncbi:hypothetical protein NG99_26200 [Erwinia typographi]|uniref:Phage portal protein n=1 Tax=Erwinia typographi TaxID=371042 RepID=A0A0A3YHL1_9GAMM|nr:hypothetical protein NG99_26200 [Erwinia typographi]
MPGESAIVSAVLAHVGVPSAPELPDVARMVTEAVAAIEIPPPPPLPDIGAMVKAAVAEQVAGIDVPQPEPLPDVAKMIADAVAALPEPELPALPDIGAMVKAAVATEVSAISLPQPEPLPDITAMVADAVSAIPAPKDGEPGTDGKDALQIEILPCIDAEKSYPRGTFASHNGGLWRSFQKTTGMNGWECVVDGVTSVDITQESERRFTVTASQASGAKTEKMFSIPVMIYRDIFSEGKTYLAGDCVTWAGSVWYCHEETTAKPGEPGSKGWTLAVKRGRDTRSKP